MNTMPSGKFELVKAIVMLPEQVCGLVAVPTVKTSKPNPLK
jgi:hypothetical protein